MEKLQKERFEKGGGNLPRQKIKLSRRTKIVSFIFSVMTILTTAGIMQAANVYYDLDTSTIVMNEIINQTGAGQVTFSGNVDAASGLDVTTANLTVGGSNFTVAPATGNVTTIGSIGIRESAGATFYTYFQGGDQAGNVTYTLPVADAGGSGYVLSSNGAGVLSWSATAAATAHALLDGGINNDTVANAPTRGSLIVGNATPAWDELTLSATSGSILRSDGTDAAWSTAAYPDTTVINQLLFSSAANTVGGVTAGTSGQILQANGSGVPGFVSMSGDATIAVGGAITLADVALGAKTSGNYVASLASGSGLTGGAAGSEGAALTLSLGNLTADWTQTGAFDIILGNADSQLQIMESAGGAFYGTIDVGDLTGNQTYTFPDKTGTVAMTSDVNSFEATGILRGQVNIFGFDYPAQCSTTCDAGAYAVISRDIITLPTFPAVLSGKTRKHRLVVRYADDLTVNGNTTVQIYNTTTPAVADSFTIAGLAADGDVEKGKALVSGDLTIPATDDWEVRVGVPAVGDKIRIYSLELAAYDVD